ncbi:MAG: ABC transporter permease [Gemmatimonadota bacterium]|nr:ABC transporter permease [Gemmatimonadota bacterium]MDE3005615.1 ABC transporter permease [Gemmatimonadota bacterium]MDE3013291.1 ABC transporter permease [Gemmatimonadota bacterium]
MSSFLAPIRMVGRGALQALTAVGRAGYLGTDAVRALRKVDLWGPHLVPQMSRIGVESVPIALFISMFTGVVLALQASYTLTGQVPLYFVGALVGKTMILELGPVLTGLALSGRVGANIAAEIGTMRVTEQIDALETLAYDPVAYLVTPRVLAGAIMFPMVVILSIAIGIAAGWGTSMALLDITSTEFIKGLRLFFDPWDIQFAAIKSITFGVTVTAVGCSFGFHTRGGAEGVGQATTRAVVISSMIILVLDAFWAAVLLS